MDFQHLTGVTPKLIFELRKHGLTCCADVAALEDADLLKVRGIGKATARTLRLHAQAVANGQAVALDTVLPETLPLPGVMLDIETCLNPWEIGVPWSFGWVDGKGEAYVAMVGFSGDFDAVSLPDGNTVYMIPNFRAGWRLIAEISQPHSGHVYHWTAYETGVLKQTGTPDAQDSLIPRMHDLHATFKRSVALPVRGRSIKTVAAFLKYQYPPESNYAQAWNDYNRWRETGDTHALARAAAYQRADVEAMWVAWRWLLALYQSGSA
jgi:predicted RecB family nuclease